MANVAAKRKRSRIHRQKFLDTSFDVSSIASAGSLSSSLCLLPQGTGQSERLGIHVDISTLHLKFVAVKLGGGSNASTAGFVRVLALLDHQCNGAMPAVTDILQTAGYLSFHKVTEYSRFHLLYENTFIVTSMPGASAKAAGDPDLIPIIPEYGMNIYQGDAMIPLDLHVSYKDAGATVASITGSNLLILVITDLDNNVDFHMNCRIRYVDF